MAGTLGVVAQLTPDTYIGGHLALPGPIGWQLDVLGSPEDAAGVSLTSMDFDVLDQLYDTIGAMRDERTAYLRRLKEAVASEQRPCPRRLHSVTSEDEARRRHPSYAGSLA